MPEELRDRRATPTPEPRPLGVEHLGLALIGAALLGAPARKKGARTAARITGLALLGAAAAPLVRQRVLGAGERRTRTRAHSSIVIARPLDEVFAFFKDFENYPRVFGGLRSVVDYGDGRSAWEACGRHGRILRWDAVTTKYFPGSVIAWQSAPGGDVDCSMVMRFSPAPSGATRLDVSAAFQLRGDGTRDALRALLTPRPRGSALASDMEHARFFLESLPPKLRGESPVAG